MSTEKASQHIVIHSYPGGLWPVKYVRGAQAVARMGMDQKSVMYIGKHLEANTRLCYQAVSFQFVA